MRIFLALDIDAEIRERIHRFREGVRGFAPDARWVRPESLHVTLKFIGEKSPEEVEAIKKAMSGVSGKNFQLTFRGHGFFPSAKSPRVFWIGIESGPALAELAKHVDQSLVVTGIPQEEHAFSPHLTLARGAGGSGNPRRQRSDHANSQFQRLQERLNALAAPEFGTMTVREFCLYESKLGPGGSKYTKLARFPLTSAAPIS